MTHFGHQHASADDIRDLAMALMDELDTLKTVIRQSITEAHHQQPEPKQSQAAVDEGKFWKAIKRFVPEEDMQEVQWLIQDHYAQQLEAKTAGARLQVIDIIAAEEGWEQTRDHYARLWGFPDKYKHDPRHCVGCNRSKPTNKEEK